MSTEYVEYKESPHPQPLPFEGREAACKLSMPSLAQ